MNKGDFSDYGLGLKKSKKEDKNKFLEEKKKERANREEKTLLIKSATKIQAFYRGSKERIANVAKFVSEVQKKLNDLRTLKAKCPPNVYEKAINLAFQKYPVILGIIVFINKKNVKQYHSIIMMLAELLTFSLNSENCILVQAFHNDKNIRNKYFYKIVKMVELVLNIMIFNNVIVQKEYQEYFEICQLFLTKMLKVNKKTWTCIESSLSNNPNINLDFAKKMKINILSRLSPETIKGSFQQQAFLNSDIFRKLILKSIEYSKPETGLEVLDKLLDTKILIQSLDKMSDKNKYSIIKAVVKYYKPDPSKKDPKVVQNRLLTYLHLISGLEKETISKSNAEFFFDSISIINSMVKDYPKTVVENAGHVIAIINNKMDIEDQDNDEDEEEKMPFDKFKFKKPKPKFDFQMYRTIIEESPEFTMVVPQEDIIYLLEYMSFAFQTTVKEKYQKTTTMISYLCDILLTLYSSFSKDNRNFLKNALAFKYDFYLIPFQALLQQGFNVNQTLESPERWSPILKIFCKVFFHKLAITDDEEFLDNNEFIQNSPVTDIINKKTIIHFSEYINKFVFDVIWNRRTDYEPIKKSCIKLLKELYNRDCRLKFCPKDFWLITEIKTGYLKLIASPNHYKSDVCFEIFKHVPHMIPFEARMQIFQKLIECDKLNQDRFPAFHASDDSDDEESNSKIVKIRRDYILEDGFQKMIKRKDMRSLIVIKFVNEHGMQEAGIDGGGLFKEFITLLSKIAFDVNYGLFLETEDRSLTPNPNSSQVMDHLRMFKFLGKITGKAIYESLLIESVFSYVFLNRILRVTNTINELKYADSTLYKNLMLLKHKEGIANSMGLNFTITEESYGEMRTILLKENGDKIEVDESNKMEYISLFCDYKLNKQIERQCSEFLEGMKSVIDLSWINCFNCEELQLVISGKRGLGFDIFDLKPNVVYHGYNDYDQTIRDFWEVLSEMTEEEQSQFLHFTTGCSRPPTLGFRYLEPKLAIHKMAYTMLDTDRLPTSSTCTNMLKLPDYKNKASLKKKLLYAIKANAGFELG